MNSPVKRLSATLVLAASALTAGAQASSVAPSAGQATTQNAAMVPPEMKAAFNRTDVTLIGMDSPDHPLGSDPKPILQALRDAGKKYVALEISPNYQPQIDRLAGGKIDRDQFLTEYAERTAQIGAPSLSEAQTIPQGAALAEIVQQATRLKIGIIAADWPDIDDLVARLPAKAKQGYEKYKVLDDGNNLDGYVHEVSASDPKLAAEIVTAIKAYRAGDLLNDAMASGAITIAFLKEKEIQKRDATKLPPFAIVADMARTGALKVAMDRHDFSSTIVHLMASEGDVRDRQAEVAALDKQKFPTVRAPQDVNYYVQSDGRWHEDPQQAAGMRGNYQALLKQLQSAPVAILGDTNHIHSILKVINTDEVLGAIAASGKKYIGVEMPPFQQEAVNQLADGKITRDEFVALSVAQLSARDLSTWNDLAADVRDEADFILHAHELGLRVIHFDPQPGENHVKREYVREVRAANKEYKKEVKAHMAKDGTKPEQGQVIVNYDDIDGKNRISPKVNRDFVSVMRTAIREEQTRSGLDPKYNDQFAMFIGAGHCPPLEQALAEKGLASTTTYLFRDENGVREFERNLEIFTDGNEGLITPAKATYLVGDGARWHPAPSASAPQPAPTPPKP